MAMGLLTLCILLSPTDLSQVIKVVLSVDPAVGRSFVQAVGLVLYVRHIWSIAEVECPLEQLLQTRLLLNYKCSFEQLLQTRLLLNDRRMFP